MYIEKNELLKKIANEQSRKMVLHIGIAHGHTSRYLAAHNVEVIVSDIEFKYVQKAKESIHINKAVAADIQTLPYRNSSFDAVVCLEVLEHVPDYQNALSEMNRIMKANGKLYLSVPTRYTELLYKTFNPDWLELCTHLNVFSKEVVFSLVKKYGFQVESYYQSNYKAAFYWIWHSLLQTQHDGTGVIKENFWVDKYINAFWYALRTLHLVNLYIWWAQHYWSKSQVMVLKKLDTV